MSRAARQWNDAMMTGNGLRLFDPPSQADGVEREFDRVQAKADAITRNVFLLCLASVIGTYLAIIAAVGGVLFLVLWLLSSAGII